MTTSCCPQAQATRIRALHLAASGALVSSRTLLSLSSTCSSLRASPLSAGLRWARPGKTAPRVGLQLFGTSTDAAASLLGWEPRQVVPKGPAVAGYEGFMERLGQRKSPSEDQYNRLMAALCQSGRFDQAWEAYQAAKEAGLRLRYNGCQQLVTLALKVGNLLAALTVFEELKALGLQPNKVMYCALMSALGKDRRRGVRSAQLAYDLWTELKGQGEKLDAAAYRAGMNACVGVGRLEEARALLKSVAAAGEANDVRAYNILLKHYARSGEGSVAAMTRLLSKMEGVGVEPSAITYNILVDGYIRAGAVAEAKRAMERAAAKGLQLDAWTYTSLLRGYVEQGQLPAAEAVLGQMQQAGIAPTPVTFTTLLDGYVKAGNLGAALGTLRAMEAKGLAPTVVTYNTLLRGYAAAIGSGLGVAGSGVAVGIGGGTGAEQSQSSSSGRVQRVSVSNNGGKPGAAAMAAASAAAAGKPANPSQQAASPTPQAQQQQHQVLQQCLRLLESMQQQGIAPNTDTYNTLMAAAVAGGRPLLALEIHERLGRAGLRPDALTYTTLMQAYARTDQVSQAMSMFEALCKDENVTLDVPAYNSAVHVLSRCGEMAAADRLAQAAARLAKKQGQLAPVEAFGALVQGYARLRQVDAAVDAVRRYHAAGGVPDVRMLRALADVCVKMGEYKVAMQTVRALELLGQPLEKQRYKQIVLAASRRAQRAQRGRQQGAKGSGSSRNGSKGGSAAASAAASASASTKGGSLSSPDVGFGTGSSGSGFGQAAGAPGGARRQRQRAADRNVHLERFKFWLGLPNAYYNASSDAEE